MTYVRDDISKIEFSCTLINRLKITEESYLAMKFFYLQSENETLQRGDVIKKIDDYDARDVRHVDAQNLLQNSESIRLVIERSEPSKASRINITTSSSIFESNTGDRAAVTSLSESNSTFVIMRSIYSIIIAMLLSLCKNWLLTLCI